MLAVISAAPSRKLLSTLVKMKPTVWQFVNTHFRTGSFSACSDLCCSEGWHVSCSSSSERWTYFTFNIKLPISCYGFIFYFYFLNQVVYLMSFLSKFVFLVLFQQKWLFEDWDNISGKFKTEKETRGQEGSHQLFGICGSILGIIGCTGKLQREMKKRTKITCRKLPSAVSYSNIHWITNAQCIMFCLLCPQQKWGQFFPCIMEWFLLCTCIFFISCNYSNP